MNSLTPRQTEHNELEALDKQETRFKHRVEKRLDHRLNKTLGLPRNTVHEWKFAEHGNIEQNWGSLYKLGGTAQTSIDGHEVFGVLTWGSLSCAIGLPELPRIFPQTQIFVNEEGPSLDSLREAAKHPTER